MPDDETPDDEDLASLRKQTSQGDRLDEAAAEKEQQALIEAIGTELDAIENGEQQKTVSVWDGHLAAFIRALEAHPEHLEEVGQGLQRQLDVDSGEIDRSTVLRLAVRLGLQEAAPEEFESLREAVRKQATKNL
jgi:hypothetical protein